MSSLTKEAARRRKYSQKQKDEFFALLDRLGSVTDAARKLGLNRETCYQWVRKAGVRCGNTPDQPVGRMKYTPEQKKEFFAVLNRVGSVTIAAAELGLNVNTGFRWASTAGIASRPLGHGRREEFVRLRGNGLSRSDAARTLGVPRGTAREWDLGIRKSRGRRIYPDGRVIDYNRDVNSLTASASPAGTSPAPPVAVSVLEKPIAPRYLSLDEREIIRDLLAVGKSQRRIAEALGRPVSTVSREIARNSSPGRGYYPYSAHRAAASRRPRPKDSKLAAEGRLRQYVKEKLDIRWSPEQISHTLVKEFPDKPEMRVSPETIYQALYVQARGGLKREVQAALRTGRARRKPRSTGEQRTSRFVDPMVMISERPPEIEDRAVAGHWESQCFCQAA